MASVGKLQRRPGDDDIFARKALLGPRSPASMGIGYAIGAQPHMTASVGLFAIGPRRTRRRDAEQGRPPRTRVQLIDQAIGEVRPASPSPAADASSHIGRKFYEQTDRYRFRFRIMVTAQCDAAGAAPPPATNSDVIEVAADAALAGTAALWRLPPQLPNRPRTPARAAGTRRYGRCRANGREARSATRCPYPGFTG